MMEIFTQMMRFPVTVFAVATRGAAAMMERWAPDEEEANGGSIPAPTRVPPGPAPAPPAPPEPAARELPSTKPAAAPTAPPQTAMPDKEEMNVADTNLSDDMIKLVDYSIITVKRGRIADCDWQDGEAQKPNGDDHHGERELHQERRVVTDNLTEDAFVTWVVADFLQNGGRGVPSHDRKYLRVYYNVLKRWPREDLRYEEDQLCELRGIREAILSTRGSSSGPPSSGGGGKGKGAGTGSGA